MKVTKQDMRWSNEPEKWKQKGEEIGDKKSAQGFVAS